MAHQFPVDMVPLLRCNVDAGELQIANKLRGDGDGLLDAVLRCRICGAEFRIEDGIVRLMPSQLSPEDEHEMIIRDTIDYDLTNLGPFIPPAEGGRSVLSDMLEIPPHLNELRSLPSSTVLELACGDGRLTIPIAETEPGFSRSIFPLMPCACSPIGCPLPPGSDASWRTSITCMSRTVPSIVPWL
jgi:uncharacterized protein YbaR (Trm112 family)